MVKLYRLEKLFVLCLLISGMQCSSPDSGQPRQDINIQDLSKKHLPDFARDTVQIYKYHKIAVAYLYQDAQKAMANAKQVLRLSQKHEWDKGKVMAYNLISTYYLLDGSYDVLRELSNETMMLSKKLNLPFYTGHALRFFAENYSEYRQWDSAQYNYDKALKIFAKIGADSARAICLESMANSYRENDIYPEAFKNYDLAFAIFGRLGSKSGQASIFQNKGYLYVRKHNYKESEKYYFRALDLFRKDHNFYGELSVLNDLGNIYFWSERYDESIASASKALEYAKKYHSWQQTNWALQTLARSHRKKHLLEKAILYSDSAYMNRRMLHNDYIQRQNTMYQLIYENTAMQQSAFEKQYRIQQFLIALVILIVAFASFLWFNNKKLRRKNSEIKEALIKGQTIERKRVAAELHDHLGGTLASLNWYLYGIDKKALSTEEQQIYDSVHQMVGAAYREVRSLSHNLMPAELQEHGLITALQRLVNKLNENKNITFTFDSNVLEKRYGNKVEFELYSIALELANNIFKHSGATIASIGLNENAKNILLSISDNGIGLNNNSKHGVGLTNVRNRIESLSGRIQIFDESGKGTRIEMEIPKTTVSKF